MDIIVKLPDIGSDEAEVVEILVNYNQYVKKDQGLLNIEGQKSSIEIPSPKDGIIKKILVKIGEKIKTNHEIFLLTIKDNLDIYNNFNYKKKIKSSDILNKKMSINNYSLYNNSYYASPLIRRLIRYNKIDILKIKGTGKKGRIIRKDIEYYIKKKRNILKNNHNKLCFDNVSKNLNFLQFGKIKNIKLNNIKKSIISNLNISWKNIPHVTHFEKIDITKLEKFRQKFNINYLTHGLNKKITLLPFIIKIISKVLQRFPNFNSSLDLNNYTIILKKYINIGVVVNTEDGLFIPVVKNILDKSILDIFKEINIFSIKAYQKKLSLSDMCGGSFTISNLGKFGGGFFTPIINFPEVAILGFSRIILKSFLNNDKCFKNFLLPISLSYDHRVINGIDAGKFISFMNEIISDIRYLLM